ncbi:tetraacyldisaccharide 4'-kinase [Pelagibacteraceae bacterium]|nr:tetraacyldisaccharide 4'-kinase [Pelagibacteraceae bacterium]
MIFKKPNFWNNINFFSIFLLPFSLITLVYNLLKTFFITPNKFNIPIICVGNLYIGGTGKTPLSIYIYNLLKKKKFSPAIIRKFYPSHKDEIGLTKSKVKQFFSEKKRKLSIFEAKHRNNNIIIMDDGLQDVSIKKDLNIVCFNSFDLVGNGFLIPAGPLRDRLEKLNDYQIAVINGKRNLKFEKKLKEISKKIKIYRSEYKLNSIKKSKGKKVLAFAGIGNSESFFSLLNNNGFIVEDKISFPDHFNYTKNEIKKLIFRAKKNKLKLITTEKDYFKIKQLGFSKIDYVSINLKIIKFKSFEKEILKNI